MLKEKGFLIAAAQAGAGGRGHLCANLIGHYRNLINHINRQLEVFETWETCLGDFGRLPADEFEKEYDPDIIYSGPFGSR